jgi:hypothetical protein
MNSKNDNTIDCKTHLIEHPTEGIIDDRYHQKSWFGKLLQAIVTAFDRHQEPIFWKKRDRNGNVYWQGYDPVSNRSLEFGSDDEARHWLDLRMPFR